MAAARCLAERSSSAATSEAGGSDRTSGPQFAIASRAASRTASSRSPSVAARASTTVRRSNDPATPFTEETDSRPLIAASRTAGSESPSDRINAGDRRVDRVRGAPGPGRVAADRPQGLDDRGADRGFRIPDRIDQRRDRRAGLLHPQRHQLAGRILAVGRVRGSEPARGGDRRVLALPEGARGPGHDAAARDDHDQAPHAGLEGPRARVLAGGGLPDPGSRGRSLLMASPSERLTLSAPGWSRSPDQAPSIAVKALSTDSLSSYCEDRARLPGPKPREGACGRRAERRQGLDGREVHVVERELIPGSLRADSRASFKAAMTAPADLVPGAIRPSTLAIRAALREGRAPFSPARNDAGISERFEERGHGRLGGRAELAKGIDRRRRRSG